MTDSFKIAIAGLGTVGGGVMKALASRAGELSRRAGRELKIVGVSARDKSKARGFELTGWTEDPLALAKGDADVVVELIGGEEGIARQLVETALANSKHVVTANKALLAKHGLNLARLAETNGVTLKFEKLAAPERPHNPTRPRDQGRFRSAMVSCGTDAPSTNTCAEEPSITILRCTQRFDGISATPLKPLPVYSCHPSLPLNTGVYCKASHWRERCVRK